MHNLYPDFKQKIKGTISYYDTIEIWLTREICKSEMENLKLLGKVRVRSIKKYHRRNYTKRLILSQPSIGLLKLLDEILSRSDPQDYVLTRVDIALDLITEKSVHADYLKRKIDFHLIQGWRGKSVKVVVEKETIYFRGIGSRNNICIYSDKPSKMTDEPCCHIEWRMKSTHAIAAKSIKSILDLIHFDHEEFWKSRLKLVSVDLFKLGQIYIYRNRKKRLLHKKHDNGDWHNYRWAGAAIFRIKSRSNSSNAIDCIEQASVQYFLDKYRDSDIPVKKALTVLDNKILLPTSTY